jgi:hypothetical protein
MASDMQDDKYDKDDTPTKQEGVIKDGMPSMQQQKREQTG